MTKTKNGVKYRPYLVSPINSKLQFKIIPFKRKKPEHFFIYHPVKDRPDNSSWMLADGRVAQKRNAVCGNQKMYCTDSLMPIVTDFEWVNVTIDGQHYTRICPDDSKMDTEDIPDMFDGYDFEIWQLAKIIINEKRASIELDHTKKWLDENIKYHILDKKGEEK